MSTSVITIPGEALLAELDAHGWTQGEWTDDDGRICAHQAIRLCSLQPGDAYLVEEVTRLWNRGTDWNDEEDTTEAEVRDWLRGGIEVTDADLEATFGLHWEAVVEVVRTAAVMTAEQARRLDAAGRDLFFGGANAAWLHTQSSSTSATAAAWAAARTAAGSLAWAAASTAATWDLATPDGLYTYAHRDTLMAPWESVFGLPAGLSR